MKEEYKNKVRSYSLDRLYKIREKIDKRKFPERFHFVNQQIQMKEYRQQKVIAESPDGFSLKNGAGVFKRSILHKNERTVSDSKYNLTLGMVLIYGFAFNYIIVKHIDTSHLLNLGIGGILLGYFASCLFGIYLFLSHKNPIVSFIGFNFVVVPFGAVLNIAVSRYDPAIVVDAIFVTGAVTVLMMSLGILYPKAFLRMEKALLIALAFFIVVEWIGYKCKIIGFKTVDLIVALIFSGYIAVDWVKANRIPKTIDNAVDSAAALYMDIINLFLRILRAMGKRRR
jgi:FtsH-binding integral membrane protein